MSTIEQLNRFFKEGAVAITFTKTEQGKCVAIAEQAFATENGQSRCKHEVMGTSFEETIEAMKQKIYHCNALEVKVRPASNGLIKI